MSNINDDNIFLFHAESVDLLDDMEETLLYLQENDVEKEHLNSIFRAFHTIKGGAAMFNFSTLVSFTHTAESLLDKIRNYEIEINNDMITLFLQIKDHVNTLIEDIIQNECKENFDKDLEEKTKLYTKQLKQYLEHKTTKEINQEEIQEDKELIDDIKELNDDIFQIQEKIKIDKPSKKETHKQHATLLKIESTKIDNIINLLGEMVITTASVMQHSNRIKDKPLKESIDDLYKILEELREASMKSRMVPISDTFNKYKRIVRDLSLELDKNIELKIIGGDTELDRIIIDKISDPIMHLVRNSIDHGIEDKETRKKYNKPTNGVITLSASHEAGNIIIKVKDDGKGLDKDKILKKAIEKGLISSKNELQEQEIFNLILQAGFSTSETVSNLSGRGVGMDVVKKNIEELRGSIEINSKLNKGMTTTIRLPLTLAIIDGFMVKIAGALYIIPLEMILECIELTKEHKEFISTNNFINLREHVLPVLDLRKFFGYKIQEDSLKKENIVIVHFGILKVGLIVDELLGEFQTVIKPIGKIFKNLKGIGGATILGDGKVCPILDIPVLLKYANEKYK
jgi:two-component system chemotaxis sensor kinase CheA